MSWLGYCYGGNLAGAVVAVYRIEHCGWTYRDAQIELSRYGGLKYDTVWPTLVLYECYKKRAIASN